MTQSKKPDFESTINISELGLENIMEDDTITINLDDTYGTTTTYWSNSDISDSNSSYTITGAADTININWIYNNMNIDPNEVERMCEEYPALEKVWRNFKAMYDMCKQDYEGKKKAGEILDDKFPF